MGGAGVSAVCHNAGEEGDRPYKVGQAGLDRVEFLLAPGPAEPLQPLRSVASGGESSRVMLALKAAPATAAPTPLGALPPAPAASLDAARTGSPSGRLPNVHEKAG